MGGAFLVIGRIGPPRIRLTESGGAGDTPRAFRWDMALPPRLNGRLKWGGGARRASGGAECLVCGAERPEGSGSALFFDAADKKPGFAARRTP